MFPVIFTVENQSIYFLFFYKIIKFLNKKNVEMEVWANFWAKEMNKWDVKKPIVWLCILLHWEENAKRHLTCGFVFCFFGTSAIYYTFYET